MAWLVLSPLVGNCGERAEPGPEPPGGPPLRSKTFKSTSTWYPVQCAGTTTYPADISILHYQAKDLHSEDNVYANSVTRPWRMLFSQNVTNVRLRFASAQSFNIEAYFDGLDLTYRNGTRTWHNMSVPPFSPNLTEAFNVFGAGAETGYLDFKWRTDAFDNFMGYNVDGLRPACHNQGAPANNLFVQSNYPHEALLLGDGDVIYVYLWQPPGYDLGLVLWPSEANPASDFDVYASTTATLPSATNSQWGSAMGAGHPEFIKIPAFTGPNARRVNIAIGSYSGAGQLRFYANLHTPASSPACPNAITVRTNFAPTTAQKLHIKNLLRKTTQAFYFATDGRHFIDTWNVQWNNPSTSFYPTGMMFMKETGLPNQCYGLQHTCDNEYGAYVMLEHSAWCGCDPTSPSCASCAADKTTQDATRNWAADTSTHELGHCIYHLADEYLGGGLYQGGCGHSIMSSPASVVAKNGVDFCDANNAGRDPQPGESGHSVARNNWGCMQSRCPSFVPYPNNATPDPFYWTASQAVLDYPFGQYITINEQ
ncbi:MAG: hypothetical protein IT371_04065 [Deltaproteobacteria bacterium]|nr:hypothetical protein [Deltaproteobacteria bacterium]